MPQEGSNYVFLYIFGFHVCTYTMKPKRGEEGLYTDRDDAVGRDAMMSIGSAKMISILETCRDTRVHI